MIRAVISGRMHGAPQSRTGASGKAFATLGLWADTGGDPPTVWCSVIFRIPG